MTTLARSISNPGWSRSRLHGLTAGAILAMALATLTATGAAGQDRPIRSFAAGDGEGDVGVSVGLTTPDREEEGPQALTVGPSGNLYMLDQVKGRILTFDPKDASAPARALELPSGLQPSDLLVKGSDILVYDGAIHALAATGPDTAPTRGLTQTRGVDTVDEATTTAFAQMGSRDTSDDDIPGVVSRGVKTNVRNDLARQLVDTHGQGKVVANVKLTDGGAGAAIEVKAADNGGTPTTLHLRVRDKLGTVAFLDIDNAGKFYVLAENIPTRIEDQAFAFVARYATNGALEGVFEVPLWSTTISRRCVTISPTGDVYFLKTLKNSVDIVGLGFRVMANAKIIELPKKPNASLVAWTDPKNIAVALGPLTRQKILQTAVQFQQFTWNVSAPSYGNDGEMCPGFAGRSRVPAYMLGKEGQPVQGVPYCWGCQGSVRSFFDRINKGTLAGNVCTKSNPRPDAAGVDCSSFVSATWGLSTHFTTAVIPAIASRLSNPWDLQPGDALDKPGSHVVLFMGFTPNREARVMEASPMACKGRVCLNTYPLSNPWDLQPGDALDKPGSHVVLFMGFTPNREARVMEASPMACKGRVCLNTYPLSWLLSRGFVPVRYRGLADAAPVGSKPAVVAN